MKTGFLGAVLSFGIALPVVFSATAARADDGAQGVWRLSDGKVTVRIAQCGGKLCGHVVALAKPLDKNGNPKVDHENPNPSLRSRRVIGLQVLSNMDADGSNSWTGTIYNADDGKTYAAYIKLKSANTMQLKACVGPFCKTKIFTRIN